MNIFIYHVKPKVCAQYHPDKHVLKMVIESAQLLSTVAHQLNFYDSKFMYKPITMNPPCIDWVKESYGNFKWLFELGCELCKEYTYRYKKIHKLQTFYEQLGLLLVKDNYKIPSRFSIKTRTVFNLSMPEEYKKYSRSRLRSLGILTLVETSKYDRLAVESYHNYFNGEKQHLHKWTRRTNPVFIYKPNTYVKKK